MSFSLALVLLVNAQLNGVPQAMQAMRSNTFESGPFDERELADFARKKAAHNTMVIVAFAMGTSYTDIALNWAAALSRTGVRSHFILALDDGSVESLRRGNAVVYTAGAVPNTVTFKDNWELRRLLWQRRWQMVHTMIQSGLTVVHSDLDAIWIRNPLAFLGSIRGDVIASHGQSAPKWLLCMGWMMIRPTAAVRNWLLPAFFSELSSPAALGDDQVAFNKALQNMVWEDNPYHCTAPAYTDLADCRAPIVEGKAQQQQQQQQQKTPAALRCRLPFMGRVHGANLSVTLLPQRMVRRHGCQTRFR
eukprot:7099941-Prymnesium_polylepis.1